ncbi:MAG: hypothetical protein CO114_01350 [Euryarchaeota archaeon CG_4_9_14_3_um_filter_38_12]|nr:MAG: hypothetical protein CO114_01350 [Euryarchaeota archaeon CG_4_9_14_3_um_filter_38_12]
MDVKCPKCGYSFTPIEDVIVVLSVFTMLGGVFALKRKHFGTAVIGAIMGIPALGFFIGALLSIISLILLITSRDEFR